jgi:hypothetical protein
VAGSIFFCQIAEAYFSGLTSGTDATHYSPSANVTRDQMAAFITRTLDQTLNRGSERAALDQFWTTQTSGGVGLTALDNGTGSAGPGSLCSDGLDIWVAAANPSTGNETVVRVRGNTGNLLQTWTGAPSANGVIVARGKVFITGDTTPGGLYIIDPTQSPGPVTVITGSLPSNPRDIAYDGLHIWTANFTSVSKVFLNPLTVATFTTGLVHPDGIVYDGSTIWVTDTGDDKLKQLDSNGNVLLSVGVGSEPAKPVFDGANIWVPNASDNTVSVVRAVGSNAGTVLATLSGNGLASPVSAAFDGERVLITNSSLGGGGSVSLWKSTDLTPLDNVAFANQCIYACSDGTYFWFTIFTAGGGKLARF